MIFNMMGSLVKKDAEWIPLTEGVQTMAAEPEVWTNYSLDFEKAPEYILIKVHYGGSDHIGVLEHNRYGYNLIYNQSDVIEDAVLVTPSNRVENLPSGSKIQFGRYDSGDYDMGDLNWTLARDTAKDNELRMVLAPESVVVSPVIMFDNKEPSNPALNVPSMGCSTWTISNIRQYLNSDKFRGEWYEAQHTYDTPPDYADTLDGFLYDFYIEELALLLYMNFNEPMLIQSGTSFAKQTVSFSDRVALMSVTELFGVDGDDDIHTRDDLPGTLDIFPDQNSRRCERAYRTRTRHNGSGNVRHVDIYGYNSYGMDARYGMAIRPMIAPKSNMPVSAEPDDAGYYQVKLEGAFHISFSTKNPEAYYLPIYDPE